MILAYTFISVVILLLIVGSTSIGMSMIFDMQEIQKYNPKKQKQDLTEIKPIITKNFIEDDDLILADDILE